MEYCCHLWDGSAKYQLATLDSIENRAKKLIGDTAIVEAKLQSLEHRRKVACLSVFFRIHFEECVAALYDLVPSSPFHLRDTGRRLRFQSYVVDIPPFVRSASLPLS